MALYSKCTNCGKKIPFRKRFCEECHKEYLKIKEQYKDEDIKRFRNSKWWKSKSKQIMKDSHYQCQLCKYEGKNTVAAEVHHIIPLSVDFEKRLEDSNLIALCEECHDEVHRGRNIPPGIGENI